MIDHVRVRVTSYRDSKAFYVPALEPLGYELLLECEGRDEGTGSGLAGGFGAAGMPDLWIVESETPHVGVHIALRSPDRATVRAFHEAALAAGGKDNGGPGLRPHYHESYYGAFVHDPDGNNVEAVCHTPEDA